MIYQTKHLYTRPWLASDAHAAFMLWGDPRVTQYIDARQQIDTKATEVLLHKQIALQSQYGVQYWALIEKNSETIIGCCGLRPCDFVPGEFELGFHLHPDFWGKGYAYEAAQGAIHYAFTELGLQRLYAGHHPANIASQKLLQKLGFQFDHDVHYPPTGLMHPLYYLNNTMTDERIRHVILQAYDPSWPIQFHEESERLKTILSDNCTAIHHIGSTAIPHIHAKPIIDIMPVVSTLDNIDQHNAAFEALGYICCGEYGIPGRRFFWKSKEKRSHHVHLFQEGNPHINRHLAFRDYLCSHPKIAAAYSQIKCQLARVFPTDIVSYVNGKQSFIQAIDYRTGQATYEQCHAADSIHLEPYNPIWPKLAAAEIETINACIHLPKHHIKHLGSTAIEGLTAKPVIDIFIALDSIAEADYWIQPLEDLGYIFWRDNPNKTHLRFFKGMPPYGSARTHHVHIMEKGTKFDERVRFHDIVSHDSELRDRYQALKQQLAIRYSEDREGYTKAKSTFIRSVLEPNASQL